MREWLKNLRTEKGLTMKDMGQKLCISESYYCAIEKKERQKQMDIALASGIAAIFEIPIAEVVALDEASD